MSGHLVIVGAVAAGASAAAKARRTMEALDITLLEAGPYMSFANCGLPYYLGGEIAERDALFVADAGDFARRFRVQVRLRTWAESIEPIRHRLAIRDADGQRSTIDYDRLILATGTVPLVPPIPGLGGPEVFACRSVPDVDAIVARLQTLGRQMARPAAVLIIGGGFIGLECAEQMLARGAGVTVVELAPQLLPPLDAEIAVPAERALTAAGATIILGDAVAGVGRTPHHAIATLRSGRRVPFDVAIVAAGVRPNVALAGGAGLQLGPSGAIAVDEHQRTSDSTIYAAGDNSESHLAPTGAAVNVALAGPANKQGRVAGANAALDLLGAPSEDRRRLRSRAILGTGIVRVCSVVAGVTGLNERRAQAIGSDIGITYVRGYSHAGYYPGAEPMIVKLVWDRADGRLLGAQAVGASGVDKRLDVFATAIQGRLTVEDLEDLDLAYAPPFSSAKDPEVMAGFVAANDWRAISPTIAPAALLAALRSGGPAVLDVRSADEYAAGHLAGSVNIPLDELRARIGEVPPDPLVVMCATGYRSYIAQQVLVHSGRRDVRNLTGGSTVLDLFTPAAPSPPAESAA